MPKKDLALLAMTYGNIYVAQVAMGASDAQCVKAFVEAEDYDGPSLIIAYSHCIAHGIDMTDGMNLHKSAVASGHWPLFRYDPRLAAKGKSPLHLDSKTPSLPYEEYAYTQTRFKTLAESDPEDAQRLLKLAQEDVLARWRRYEQIARAEVKPDAEEG
jgi:pyruvate-ferredoxin/flavodoxin oxidoreductase